MTIVVPGAGQSVLPPGSVIDGTIEFDTGPAPGNAPGVLFAPNPNSTGIVALQYARDINAVTIEHLLNAGGRSIFGDFMGVQHTFLSAGCKFDGQSFPESIMFTNGNRLWMGAGTPAATITAGVVTAGDLYYQFSNGQWWTCITGGGIGTWVTKSFGTMFATAANDLLGCAFADPGVVVSLSQTTIAAATIFVARIPLLQPESITNVVAFLAVLGVTLTHSFVALFNSAGTVLGQSADQSVAWETGGTTGFKTVPLAGGPVAVAPIANNDFIWAALFVGTAGTAPQFGYVPYTSSGIANIGCTVARTRFGNIAQADTANLPNIVPANLSQSNNARWMAVS